MVAPSWDVSGAVKEQKSLSKEQTSKVQIAAQNTTTAANNTASTAKNTTASNGTSTSASNSNNTNTNTSSANNSNANTSNGGNATSGNGGYVYTPPTFVTCPTCGEEYDSSMTHECSYYICGLCGQKVYNYETYHDCPYTRDAYGNKVLKTSRYVDAIGAWGTKRYSDGTYEVTDEGRNANRQAYEAEDLASPDYWGVRTLDEYVINNSGV